MDSENCTADVEDAVNIAVDSTLDSASVMTQKKSGNE